MSSSENCIVLLKFYLYLYKTNGFPFWTPHFELLYGFHFLCETSISHFCLSLFYHNFQKNIIKTHVFRKTIIPIRRICKILHKKQLPYVCHIPLDSCFHNFIHVFYGWVQSFNENFFRLLPSKTNPIFLFLLIPIKNIPVQ